MKEIQLTRGMVALVDDEDFEYLRQFNWHANKQKHTYYALRHNTGAGGRRAIPRKIKMHRQILGVTDQSIKVDHRDSDGLNNQKHNLRRATRNGNQANSKKIARPCSSKFKGVSFDRKRGSWYSYIGDGKQRRFLGRFALESEAAMAYDSAALVCYGEFARLNF